MQQIKSIEAKAEQAIQLLQNNRTLEACDIFLDVWEDLKDLMQRGFAFRCWSSIKTHLTGWRTITSSFRCRMMSGNFRWGRSGPNILAGTILALAAAGRSTKNVAGNRLAKYRREVTG